MRWLIIEDSLESLKGHWYENLQGFHQELPRVGDQLIILCSRRAEPFILENLGAQAILPESQPLRQSKAGKVQRAIKAFGYFIKSYYVLAGYLRKKSNFDLIYVSDVTLYQLVVWVCLIKTVLRRKKTRVLLFFLGLPVHLNGGHAILNGSFTARVMQHLLRVLAPEIVAQKVLLGVEAQAVKSGAESALGLQFIYFPQCVPSMLHLRSPTPNLLEITPITMACYGPARYEKGSDILVAAIKKYLERFPGNRVRFIVQWKEDFEKPNGSTVRLPEELRSHTRVEVISRFIPAGEYAEHLARTDVLLLPYRRSSYVLRGSRVVVEAMVNALPMITTEGTTLHEQMQHFGSGLTCIDGDVDSLVTAMREMELRYYDFQKLARERQPSASEHYSLRTFRDLLLSPGRVDYK
jgi:glycosyltransferase involved in cell wall biosynthesis